jgi:outer membrane murein-binding lipoprotein Lpp
MTTFKKLALAGLMLAVALVAGCAAEAGVGVY